MKELVFALSATADQVVPKPPVFGILNWWEVVAIVAVVGALIYAVKRQKKSKENDE